MENVYFKRIEAIRLMMAGRGWDAIVITSSDPHNSEYPAPRWKQVEWLSGFSGEAGDIVITMDHAGLWTDTRYFIQASKDLRGTGIELHKIRVPGQVPIPEWLATQAFPGREGEIVIAVDGLTQTVASIESMKAALRKEGRVEDREAGGFSIVNMPDLLSAFWTDRPEIPVTPIITLGTDITGESRQEKIIWLRKFLQMQEADAILLTALDEIAWLLNVRGSDVAYNPVVISYLLVSKVDVRWYVKKNGLQRADDETMDSFNELRSEGISIVPYDDMDIGLMDLKDNGDFGRLCIDINNLNYSLYSTLLSGLGAERVLIVDSPVPLRKAVKNEVEIQGMRDAHVEDGLAMEKFLYWLEKQIETGTDISEADAACKLQELRGTIEGYRGDSFETISAYGEGAALPHYVTPKVDAPVLFARGLYLNDSGGQYIYGTTDITRTVPLGGCSRLEKEDYTLVLKGHIDLAKAVFPKGTAGCQIDVLARNPLWAARRNFGHGTGHGVGFYLNVHEGPQDIRQNFNSVPLQPGMITSDEPGIYREGMHGVRHESLLLCKEAGENDFGSWLCFEVLTLCHIDTSAIIRELLGPEEVEWLNAYNRRVYETLSSRLSSELAKWLEYKTAAI